MWRTGRVSVVDYEKSVVRVEYPDIGEQSGELIVLQGRNEKVREYSMPEIGEVGICLLDINGCGFYIGSGYTQAHPAPEGSGKGFFITDYGDGTRIEYDKNSKKMSVNCSGEITLSASTSITLKAPSILIDGAQSNTKTIDVTGTVTSGDDVVASGISLVKHTHGGIQGGNGSTKPPE